MRKRGMIIFGIIIALVAVLATFFALFLRAEKSAGKVLLDYLRAMPEETELVVDGLVTPNASITLDDTEITVTEMLYDDRFAYLAYEIKLPEGFPEDAPPPWLGTSFCLAPTGSDEMDTWHDFMPISEERSGQVIHVIAEVHLGLIGTEDAYDAILFLTRPEDIAGEDYRELRWSLTGSPLAQSYEANEKIWDGGPILTRLLVSPLSVCAMLEGAESFDGLTVQVFFKDGIMFDTSRVRITSGLDVTYLEDGTSVIRGGDVGYSFERIVDLSTIERVVVGDVEVFVG